MLSQSPLIFSQSSTKDLMVTVTFVLVLNCKSGAIIIIMLLVLFEMQGSIFLLKLKLGLLNPFTYSLYNWEQSVLFSSTECNLGELKGNFKGTASCY